MLLKTNQLKNLVWNPQQVGLLKIWLTLANNMANLLGPCNIFIWILKIVLLIQIHDSIKLDSSMPHLQELELNYFSFLTELI